MDHHHKNGKCILHFENILFVHEIMTVQRKICFKTHEQYKLNKRLYKNEEIKETTERKNVHAYQYNERRRSELKGTPPSVFWQKVV